MHDRPLNVDSVRAFVRIAELGSFTRAAEVMQTTQAAVSLKLKRLEEILECRLLVRTPRYVELSSDGVVFLEHARTLLEAHDRAYAALGHERERLTIGISDHVAGPELPALIARMNAADPKLLIEIRIGSSNDLLLSFDHRDIDAVVTRFHADRDGGVVLAEEQFGWFAAADWRHHEGEPVPIATMPEPCGVRAIADRLLDEAGIPCTEVFSGGGVSAVAAAVDAGLGVAALAPRMLRFGAVDVGPRLGLPKLPKLPVLMHSRVQSQRSNDALVALSAAFKSAVKG